MSDRTPPGRSRGAVAALRGHWAEYALEALELGLFMVSACFFAVVLQHPSSPLRQLIDAALVRRLLMGTAMGLTAIALIYSPFGQRSGAHMNPAVTLTFWRLGKIASWDAAFYITAQFLGGAAGVALMAALIGPSLAHESVRYAATLPGRMGPAGAALAWLGEFAISLLLMLVVLIVSNHRALARWTGVCAGALVAMYITLEDPISGMSMNPARSFGSALAAQRWSELWIYFTAPPLAMLGAAEIYRRLPGARRVFCAKLNHFGTHRCIFRCEFDQMLAPGPGAASAAGSLSHDPLSAG